MEYSFNTLAFFFISILSISTATQTIEPDSCGPCTKPHPSTPKTPIITLPPIGTVPPVVTVPKVPIPPVGVVPVFPIPPVTVPKVPVPPVTTVPIPPVTVPTVPVPPVTVPPVTVPKVPVPPVTVTIPPVTVPIVPILPPVTVPIINPPVTNPPKEKPCTPARPAKKATCPIDTLKLGACGDLLGGLVHVGLGDPAVNKCCPVLEGLAETEAAACLCTTLKINGLNLNIYVPIALQLLVYCGKTPPPGYTCSI